MIDHLRHMAIFAKVVDSGSFKAAAEEMGLAPSRTSETVSELEQHLGVTLLYRTTRKLSLTNEGTIFYKHVVEMLGSAQAGLNDLNALSENPVGALRISIPAFMATGPLSTAIARFAHRYPKISLSVAFTDHPKRLIEDGFDLNIRVGWLDDSSMMSRQLAEGRRLLVVGPDYAQGRDLPTRPSDLEDWKWIHYQQRARAIEFTSEAGQTEKVAVDAQVEIDNIDALHHFARQNVGVTILPSYLALPDIASGKLIQLLPDWHLRPLGIFAVWPDRWHRESLIQVLVEFLTEQELC